MTKAALHPLLEDLATAGQLLRIGKPVHSELEIAEITRRVVAAGGPALLFEQVEGCDWPVVTNVFGTAERLCLGLQIEKVDDLAELGRAALVDQLNRQGKRQAAEPRVLKQAPSQQVFRLGRDIDLTRLPALRHWPDESGPTLWGRLFHHAESRVTSSFLCRAQVLDRNRLVLVDDGWPDPIRSLAESLDTHSKGSVAFVPGGSASELLVAASGLGEHAQSLGEKLDQGQPQEVTTARSCELLVPATAQVIIEGTIEPATSGQVIRASSLSGNHYLSTSSPVILHVAVLTHRASPIVMNLVHGATPADAVHGDIGVLHKAVERISLPFYLQVVPDLTDISMPFVGAWQGVCVLALRKSSDGQARRAAHAVWGLPCATRVKLLVVVDEGTPIHHWPSIITAIVANVDFVNDVLHSDGPAQFTDFVSNRASPRRSIAIDATTKLPGEGRTNWPPPIVPATEIAEQVSRRWAELGLPPLVRSNGR